MLLYLWYTLQQLPVTTVRTTTTIPQKWKAPQVDKAYWYYKIITNLKITIYYLV